MSASTRIYRESMTISTKLSPETTKMLAALKGQTRRTPRTAITAEQRRIQQRQNLKFVAHLVARLEHDVIDALEAINPPDKEGCEGKIGASCEKFLQELRQILGLGPQEDE